jgi:hypothetical protein
MSAMKKITNLLTILVIISGLLTGCNKEPEDPPTLPPVESMTIDFSNFETGKKCVGYSQSKGIENANWEFAALVAGYWNTIIVSTLAVPVISFNKVIDENPVYIDDRTWEWNYDFTFFTATYKARLTGQIRTTDVEWKMYISREGSGGFSEFVWFQGTSKIDGTGGQWILNYSPSYKEPVLQIDWTKSGTSLTSVRYTYVRALNDARQSDPNNGSFIEYSKMTGKYDAKYVINYYNGADFSEMEVQWSTIGRNGSVKCLKFFGDTEWHCWDGNYVNVACL